METGIKTGEIRRIRKLTRNNSIPLIVDNTIHLPGNDLVRLVYFSVDSTENPKHFTLKVKGEAIPFLMIGFQGIIYTPLKGTRFLKPDSITGLFDRIEESDEFFVDTNDIWMPLSVFTLKPSRGSVYRISRELFTLAIRYRYDKIELESFIPLAEKYNDHIWPSVSETKAFGNWSLGVIQEARDIYPKNDELRLSFIESTK